MSWHHVLVAVAMTPESHLLVEKAVSVVRPNAGKVSLITLASDPELYNSFAAPMLENMRELMQEEITLFLEELKARANYPIEKTHIVYGELSEHVCAHCKHQHIDLVVCGNHSQAFFNTLIGSARRVIDRSDVDVLIVPL
ncbi:Universal stress protein UspC [Paramixta manurensis]|uniref:Universal stress protein n=1 Tax=Paramixta manurensis TaxID=2740817 RepID=A0A6M8UQV6_9GAMM|nr:Universal stress protein UspC [Erwiniaceae bacterium PD-1]